MHGIDLRGMMNKYVEDESVKIPRVHLDTVCKKGQGKECCKYIGLFASHYFCAKFTPMAESLENRASEGKMNAQGDNCPGLGEQKK